MPKGRHHARVLAMQTLCQWDVQKDEDESALDDFLSEQEASDKERRYGRELVMRYWSMREDVDRRISESSTKWDITRISPVERNTMRVAVSEMLGVGVPAKVAIDEAIDLARAFGGKDSPRFVNGVLDGVLRKIEEETGKTN
jgi:transcription antitermination protein NusB